MRLRTLGTWLAAQFRDESIAPEKRLAIYVSLLTARARQSAVISLVGATVAASVFWDFKKHTNYHLMDVGFIAVFSFYATLINHSLLWLRTADKSAQFGRFMREFVAMLFLLGASWGLVLITTLRVGSDDQRGLVYALAIGLISTMMISGPIRYAFAFWIPVTAGAFIALVSDAPHRNFAIITALFCYGLISLFAIVSVNRKMFERELSLHKIQAHNETSSLFLQDFQEGTGSFVWETDARGDIKDLGSSKSFALLCGYAERAAPLYEVLRAILCTKIDRNEAVSQSTIAHIIERMDALKSFRDTVLCVATKIGARWWSLSGKPVFAADGQFIGYRGVCTDVTERETYKQKIEMDAERDYLTGVYNRSAFNRFLSAFCAAASRESVSLLCLDLDHFKTINDNFGHAAGDAILIAVTERLKSCIRKCDLLFRLGGDEFAILAPGGSRAQAINMAHRIAQSMSDPFAGGQVSLKVGVSVGIALVPDHGNQPDLLHRKADIALYRSKTTGRGGFIVYDQNYDQQLEYEQAFETELTYALERGQFAVVFQPIVNLASRRVVGAEALLRWTHPVFGVVAPARFIPYLEKGSQIAAVGLYVIEQGLRVAALLPAEIILSINLSSVQLSDIELPEKISKMLGENAVDSGQIDFEITESSLLQEDSQKLSVLSDIQALGCGIAIDDFGTGYSSLRLLDKFEFDKIKIDASFIHGLVPGSRRRLILESIIDLGAKLHLTITGEGIETEAQQDQLRGLGCVQGQGFLYHRPMDSEALLAILGAERVAGLSLQTGASFE